MLAILARAVPAAVLAIVAQAAGASPVAAGDATEFPPGYEQYHTFTELVDELHAIDALDDSSGRNIVSLSVIGTSHEGRDIWLVKIGDNVAANEDEPEVLITGLTHAREHISAEQALAVIHWLVDGYASGDERETALVQSNETWIIPALNPDGAAWNIRDGVLHRWRKNRQPTAGSTYVGTDINRNFGYRWGCCGGSSSDPRSLLYRGPTKWSTPEARVERDFVRSRVVDGRQQIRLAFSLHSHAEKVLFPYGYTREKIPADMDATDRRVLVALARGVASRNGYVAQQGGRWYITSGTFGDWAYARQGIYPFVLELPPPASERGFNVPGEELAAELERNRPALLWWMEQAACPVAVIGGSCAAGPRAVRSPATARQPV